jgi:hypothetical protein
MAKDKNFKLNAAFECVKYILEHESDDFENFPSENHVYFHAWCAISGLAEAKAILNQVIGVENVEDID